ncbi:MAG: hypothetical protein PHR51_01015 [Patescibacteria group bacterium]|nr:hypothetical protein [Patescibacteria group bacterium]
MLHTPHFLTGVVIATQIPDPVVASAVALTSHFVLDAIPHADYIDVPEITPANVVMVVADGVVALSLFFALVEPQLWGYAFVIGVMASLPDFIELPKYFSPKWATLPGIKQFSHWHGITLQFNRDLPFPKRSWSYWILGLLPQVILTVFLVSFLVAR